MSKRTAGPLSEGHDPLAERRLVGLTPRSCFHERGVAPLFLEPLSRGDVVRVETERHRHWIYLRIEEVADAGDLHCTVVASQSWADIALIGAVAGRRYLVARSDVLSVVHEAESMSA